MDTLSTPDSNLRKTQSFKSSPLSKNLATLMCHFSGARSQKPLNVNKTPEKQPNSAKIGNGFPYLDGIIILSQESQEKRNGLPKKSKGFLNINKPMATDGPTLLLSSKEGLKWESKTCFIRPCAKDSGLLMLISLPTGHILYFVT